MVTDPSASCRGGSRRPQEHDPADARLPENANGLSNDHGTRGHARDPPEPLHPAGARSDSQNPSRQSAVRPCCLRMPIGWVQMQLIELLQQSRARILADRTLVHRHSLVGSVEQIGCCPPRLCPGLPDVHYDSAAKVGPRPDLASQKDDLSLDLGQIVGTFPGVQVVLPPGGVPGNII